MATVTRQHEVDWFIMSIVLEQHKVEESLMIRTVPETTGEGIELYIRTYYSLLRSSGDIRIRSLEETHEGMLSSLHLKAESAEFDASAFTYAAFRLPDCLHQARRVVMGQSEEVFVRHGLRDIATWQRVDAAARRRRMLFDGQETLAAFVSSVSDIDDLIPCLTAFQIEWNKLHWRLTGTQLGSDLAAGRALASTDACGADSGVGDHRLRTCNGCARSGRDTGMTAFAQWRRSRWICGCAR